MSNPITSGRLAIFHALTVAGSLSLIAGIVLMRSDPSGRIGPVVLTIAALSSFAAGWMANGGNGWKR